MRFVFRTDASVKMGSGHAMRCLTLAKELRKRGAEITFISRAHEGNLNGLISDKGMKVAELSAPNSRSAPVGNGGSDDYAEWLGVTQEQDAHESINALSKTTPDWLIVDHYGLDEAWETVLRTHVKNIMVIDDLANRHHVCDILLDQNWFEKMDTRYDNLLPVECIKLLGPKFALLRKEFSKARKTLKLRNGAIERVFVFLAGSDPDNLTGMTIQALSVPELVHLELDVVIGDNNPNKNQIKKLIEDRPLTNLHIQVDNIAEIMSKSNFSIGAGGSAIWERCCIGLASCVITLADNQLECVKDLSKINVLDYLGHQNSITVQNLTKSINRLIPDNKKLIELSVNSLKLADGLGTKRVCEKIINYD